MLKFNSPCVICLSSNHSQPPETGARFDVGIIGAGAAIPFQDPEEIENGDFILRTFCSSFGIQLPLAHESLMNVTVDWNLEEENLPFCNSCERLAENLVELCQQLETIKNDIETTKAKIRSVIVKSGLASNQNQSTSKKDESAETTFNNEDSDVASYNSDLSVNSGSDFESKPKNGQKFFLKKLKTKTRVKDKVDVLRELIVGPTLRIHRCDLQYPDEGTRNKKPQLLSSVALEPNLIPESPPNEQFKSQLEPIIVIREEFERQPEAEFDLEPESGPEPDVEEIGHLDVHENSGNENDSDPDWGKGDGVYHRDRCGSDSPVEIPKPRYKTRKTKKIFKPLKRSGKTYRSYGYKTKRTKKYTIPSKSPFRKQIKDYIEKVVNAEPEPEPEPEWQEHQIQDTDHEERYKTTSSSSSSEEDDYRDEDFILNESEEELLESTTKLGYRLKVREPDYKPMKYRKIVKCEGDEDKYLYDNRFEFTGNELVGFKCVLCPTKNFQFRRHVLQHIRDLHTKDDVDDENGKLLCTFCGKQFKATVGLERHLEVHKEKRKICEVCGEKFRTDTLLKFHMKRAHTAKPDKSAVCEYCGKVFKSNAYVHRMRKHIEAVHMKKKSKFCDQCGKGFFNDGALRIHMASHSTDRPYPCKFCPQKFKKKGHRTRHEKQFHGYLKNSKNSKDQDQNQESASTNVPISASVTQSDQFDSEQEQQQQQFSNEEQQPKPSGQQTMSAQRAVLPLLQNEEDAEKQADPAKLSLKCQHCGLQYNRQNNLTRHLLQIHNINIKGLNWKSKYRPRLKKSKPKPTATATSMASPSSEVNINVPGHPSLKQASDPLPFQTTVLTLVSNPVSFQSTMLNQVPVAFQSTTTTVSNPVPVAFQSTTTTVSNPVPVAFQSTTTTVSNPVPFQSTTTTVSNPVPFQSTDSNSVAFQTTVLSPATYQASVSNSVPFQATVSNPVPVPFQFQTPVSVPVPMPTISQQQAHPRHTEMLAPFIPFLPFNSSFPSQKFN